MKNKLRAAPKAASPRDSNFIKTCRLIEKRDSGNGPLNPLETFISELITMYGWSSRVPTLKDVRALVEAFELDFRDGADSARRFASLYPELMTGKAAA